jgi:hypothetical protein
MITGWIMDELEQDNSSGVFSATEPFALEVSGLCRNGLGEDARSLQATEEAGH